MSQYKCASPQCRIAERRFERPSRRAFGCPTPDSCRLVPVTDDADAAPNETFVPAVLRFTKPPDERVAAKTRLRLLLRGEAIEVPLPQTLGRQGFLGAHIFEADTTISRRHAEVEAESGGVRIRNVASSGNTLIADGKSLIFNQWHTLSPGAHILQFGPTFVAEIEVVS